MKVKIMAGRSGRLMKVLLVTLAIALGTFISVPALAQAQGSTASDQYESSAASDQYGNSGVGHRASDDAVKASEAFNAPADDTEEGAAFAAEVTTAPVSEPETASAESEAVEAENLGEDGPAITELPDTGGSSPLTLGVLLVIGGLLVPGIARKVLRL